MIAMAEQQQKAKSCDPCACQKCGNPKTSVLWTYRTKAGIRRMRLCEQCGNFNRTTEKPDGN